MLEMLWACYSEICPARRRTPNIVFKLYQFCPQPCRPIFSLAPGFTTFGSSKIRKPIAEVQPIVLAMVVLTAHHDRSQKCFSAAGARQGKWSQTKLHLAPPET